MTRRIVLVLSLAVGVTVASGLPQRADSAATPDAKTSTGAPVVSTAGASVYAKKCAVCHGANGQGGGRGQFPALAGNKLVNGDAAPMLAVIEHGRSMMPSWKGQLSPGDIAAVATYVRSAWGNKGGPVTEQDVTAVK